MRRDHNAGLRSLKPRDWKAPLHGMGAIQLGDVGRIRA